MSAWVRATVDSSGETIYLNLDHADRMQRQGPDSSCTSVQFFERAGLEQVRVADERGWMLEGRKPHIGPRG